MEIDVLVLPDARHDGLAEQIGEALAERGVSTARVSDDTSFSGSRVLVALGRPDPAHLKAATEAGLAVLPALVEDGWLAGDIADRARRIADAVDALLIIGQSLQRTSDEAVARASADIRDCLDAPDDSGTPLVRICEALSLAIQWGAPIYNRGDVESCAMIYRDTAHAVRAYIEREVAHGGGQLLDAIDHELETVDATLAELGPDRWDEQAWTLRHTFDRILIARRTAKALQAIDDLFGGLVRAGRRPNASLVYDIISVSISHGAPIYNSGSPVGCAQIYLGTAAGLLRLLGAEAHADEGQTEPLSRELLTPLVAAGGRRLESDADGLAWSLRRAFDRLVEAAARERTWEHDS